jgi:hypothetical protein
MFDKNSVQKMLNISHHSPEGNKIDEVEYIYGG